MYISKNIEINFKKSKEHTFLASTFGWGFFVFHKIIKEIKMVSIKNFTDIVNKLNESNIDEDVLKDILFQIYIIEKTLSKVMATKLLFWILMKIVKNLIA